MQNKYQFYAKAATVVLIGLCCSYGANAAGNELKPSPEQVNPCAQGVQFSVATISPYTNLMGKVIDAANAVKTAKQAAAFGVNLQNLAPSIVAAHNQLESALPNLTCLLQNKRMTPDATAAHALLTSFLDRDTDDLMPKLQLIEKLAPQTSTIINQIINL